MEAREGQGPMSLRTLDPVRMVPMSVDYLGKRTGTPELLSVCLQLSLQTLYSAMFLQGAINHIQASRVVHLPRSLREPRMCLVLAD